MRRRAFLSSLLAGAGALALDPERALWVPGRKVISIPAPRCIQIGYELWTNPYDGVPCETWSVYDPVHHIQLLTQIYYFGEGRPRLPLAPNLPHDVRRSFARRLAVSPAVLRLE